MSKLWASTFFCAPSMAFVSQRCSMTSPSFIPIIFMSPWIRSDPKMRMRSSSRDRKKIEEPGVALPAGAAAELVVDAARLVALGADDVEPAEADHLLVLLRGLRLELGDALLEAPRPLGPAREEGRLLLALHGQVGLGPHLVLRHHLGVAAEDDVGAAAGHVGGDGDAALAAGLRDDLGLPLVVLRVEDVVRHAAALEERGHHLALRHRDGADEDRLALLVPLPDLLADRLELLALAPVDDVLRVLADVPHVRRDRRRRRGCRSSRTPPPRCRPCRSCRPASSTCGSSSGRRWWRGSGSRPRSSRPPSPRPPGGGRPTSAGPA